MKTAMDSLISRVTTLLVILLTTVADGSAQAPLWKLEQGKAVHQRKILIPGKTQYEIYKDVNRWLVKYYRDPEENLKARIEGEYLRGVGYNRGIVAAGESPFDLQYSFVFEVGNQEVIFSVTDVVIIHSKTEDTDGTYRLEDYLTPSTKKKKKESDEEKVLTSLNEFVNSLFLSFEKSVALEDVK
jgi:hypothetical protein